MKAAIKIKTGDRTVVRQTRRGNTVRVLGGGENYTVDVKNGKFIFDLANSGAKVAIQEADIDNRHILINVQQEIETKTRKGGTKKEITNDKWLCGHDERDWFVAAVKGKTIWEAKQGLKPKEVLAVEKDLKPKEKQKRKNEAFRRQGEWFFIKAPELTLPPLAIIHNDEPISRGGGSKAHIVEEVYRSGGRTVYVRGATILSPGEYEKLEEHLKAGYVQRTADASVYGRGYVKHPDHETIILDGWHKILMNTESGRKGTLIFLD